MADDTSLLAEIEARYEAARDHASRWREEAREAFRFYAGEQWDDADVAKMEEQQRPVVTFNRVMRLVNAVIGHEANNRAEVRYVPRTLGDARVNELLTSASAYFRDACDAEFEESDAFRDMIVSGMGWTNDRLSDTSNPDYDLIEERVDPLEMLWDPSSQKPNLADARYLFRRKRYAEKEIKAIWPDFTGPFGGGFDDDIDDEGEPVDRSPRSSYRGDGDSRDIRPDILVLEYQYKEREAYYVVSQPGVAETVEIAADDLNEELRDRLKERGIPFVMKRRTVARRCFVIGRTIVQGPDVVCPHDFTYHCMTGFRDREHHHWFGIVRMLKDPQRWSNKWLAQIMHILNSNAKGGLMAEESAVADRHEFEASWADPAAVTWFADGALKNNMVQPKPPPTWPAGVERLLQYANASFNDVSGVNQELLGLADREQPGVLEWQRKQSAVTLLAPLFDSLRRFRKMQGRCWLYMMQRYVSDGRIIRITQDNGQVAGVPFGGSPETQAPLPPQWKLPETADYDVIVDQAATAPNQKEQTWAVLSQLFPLLGNILPPQMMMLAVEYSPLPESFVAKLKEMQKQLESQGPPPNPGMVQMQAQMQAQQAELQMRRQEAEAQMQLDRARAQNDMEIQRQKLQAQIELDRQRAQSEAMLSAEKLAQEAHTAEQRQALEAEAQGLKLELASAAADGRGPITRLFEGLSERQDQALAALAESNMRSSSALAAGLADLARALMADNELVRDPRTGRAIGTRRVARSA
ncbi:portal protein [Reyranella sp. CPCC 100927]|uniref:portal protein n=1 Tax=Reyranella sp. CPCC 100927 TaxID=2599616 RepID=UPI0011B3D50A|nr:portal protein [Reyranella sp. CPCC 100927]TWT11687.1 hypothetical protein FQU96_14525 [Reyranella sp. CPCC 100927]